MPQGNQQVRLFLKVTGDARSLAPTIPMYQFTVTTEAIDRLDQRTTCYFRYHIGNSQL